MGVIIFRTVALGALLDNVNIVQKASTKTNSVTRTEIARHVLPTLTTLGLVRLHVKRVEHATLVSGLLVVITIGPKPTEYVKAVRKVTIWIRITITKRHVNIVKAASSPQGGRQLVLLLAHVTRARLGGPPRWTVIGIYSVQTVLREDI